MVNEQDGESTTSSHQLVKLCSEQTAEDGLKCGNLYVKETTYHSRFFKGKNRVSHKNSETC